MRAPKRIPALTCDCHVHVFGPADTFPLSPDASYVPEPAPAESLVAAHRTAGIDRVVIVQPSVYGADNACTLNAIARLGDAARGVAVIAEDASKDVMRRLHHDGIRGIRLNFGASGVADPNAIAGMIEAAARRVADQGWHVQVFAPLSAIARLAPGLGRLPVPIVIDHFGFPSVAAHPSDHNFQALLDLLASGNTYVKLSAAYLFSEASDWSDVAPLARALIGCNPSRLLWGSNWPHPGGGTGTPGMAPKRHPAAVDEAVSLERLAEWVGDDSVFERILVHNPAHLFGF